jgi:hypothetical protein
MGSPLAATGSVVPMSIANAATTDATSRIARERTTLRMVVLGNDSNAACIPPLLWSLTRCAGVGMEGASVRPRGPDEQGTISSLWGGVTASASCRIDATPREVRARSSMSALFTWVPFPVPFPSRMGALFT